MARTDGRERYRCTRSLVPAQVAELVHLTLRGTRLTLALIADREECLPHVLANELRVGAARASALAETTKKRRVKPQGYA